MTSADAAGAPAGSDHHGSPSSKRNLRIFLIFAVLSAICGVSAYLLWLVPGSLPSPPRTGSPVNASGEIHVSAQESNDHLLVFADGTLVTAKDPTETLWLYVDAPKSGAHLLITFPNEIPPKKITVRPGETPTVAQALAIRPEFMPLRAKELVLVIHLKRHGYVSRYGATVRVALPPLRLAVPGTSTAAGFRATYRFAPIGEVDARGPTIIRTYQTENAFPPLTALRGWVSRKGDLPQQIWQGTDTASATTYQHHVFWAGGLIGLAISCFVVAFERAETLFVDWRKRVAAA